MGAIVVARQNMCDKNPAEKSWMDVQTPVKNQGACGSCWTFATTECVESHLAIAEGITTNSSKPLEILAPQTLVNCVKNPNECGGTGGCEGATGVGVCRDGKVVQEKPFHHIVLQQAERQARR